MPTAHPRINLVRDRSLESKLETLANYAKAHNIKRDSELVREMINAGYEELRRRELREAVEINLAIEAEGEDVGLAAARLNAQLEDVASSERGSA